MNALKIFFQPRKVLIFIKDYFIEQLPEIKTFVKDFCISLFGLILTTATVAILLYLLYLLRSSGVEIENKEIVIKYFILSLLVIALFLAKQLDYGESRNNFITLTFFFLSPPAVFIFWPLRGIFLLFKSIFLLLFKTPWKKLCESIGGLLGGILAN